MAGEKMAFTETVKNTFKKLFTTKKIVEEGKADIVEAIAEKDPTACPFPEWKEYNQIWKTLDSEGQRWMKRNIGAKDADGKIEIIPMERKFFILSAEHNGIDIFKRSDKNRIRNDRLPGVAYIKPKAAERECKRQNLLLFENKREIKNFIDYFPGSYEKEKIDNCITLFGLKNRIGFGGIGRLYLTGFKESCNPGGYDPHYDSLKRSCVWGIYWSEYEAEIGYDREKFPSQYLVSEYI